MTLFRIFICLGFMLFSNVIRAGEIRGRVLEEGVPLLAVNVSILGTTHGSITDEQGQFVISNVPSGQYRIFFSLVGYRSKEISIALTNDQPLVLEVSMEPDLIGLEAVVVSATRNEIPVHRSPVIVNIMDDRLFSMTQSISLAEGLSFSPGLRMENNCQNCGFTQVRMNGLDGAYSQILINSRPVFSALAGVYGLEQIPANMIERVEIIRGAGSVLYGGNAIGGTINIITKDPVVNSFEAGSSMAFTGGVAPDWTTSVNASVVDEEMKTGMSLYALNRNRDYFDANGDGLSELTKTRNTTFGLNSFYRPGKNSRLGLSLYHINEFRRGGGSFELEPHFADVAEQLQHAISGGGINYEVSTSDLRSRLAVYASAQSTGRNSYYGAGGGPAYRYLVEREVFIKGPQNDEDLAMLEQFNTAQNAYGRASDVSLSGGFQVSHAIAQRFTFVGGSEVQQSATLDNIPGYARSIDQRVRTLGSYIQLEYQATDYLTFLAGGRYDYVYVRGRYQLEQQFDQRQSNPFHVAVPRLSVLYRPMDHWKIRASFAQGYRAPQAFDEDMHLETVGGAARVNVLSDSLRVERSNSFTLSSDLAHRIGAWQGSFVVEGFYTRLNNPFINANPEILPSGIFIVTKRNGESALVAGANIEWRVAVSRKMNFQMGLTLQEARYATEESIWQPDEIALEEQPGIVEVVTRNLLRTPQAYGFAAALWKPVPRFTLNVSGTYTGTMDAPHVVGTRLFPETASETLQGYTEIKKTPVFFDFSIKAAYDIRISKGTSFQVYAGVQNIFNSYQRDFDLGVDRDAGYVYGPNRPFTPFLGVKLFYL
jgi:outer membrane receptor for ferrienterochelin and colicins